MSKPPIPRQAPLAELEPGEDVAALRRDAERWRWLRERAVRVQGSDVWYQGIYLDLRADIGLGHAREDSEPQ
ncbi:hypothetical protein [Pseudomonas sp. F1002]|uniref:hypothetical protein n=1 Tax=Pseudomonas sp. F1002 TaxID=2738821 RepID=UPI0015A43EF6|nr:hypothetical protein [Pseudomonas sp. F1002]NWB63490.1 hypothetical protein [Pseudomonas sp. F1002]